MSAPTAAGRIAAALPEEVAVRVARRVAWADERDLAGRLVARDHTLWAPEPTEISNRLGWLDAPGRMLGSGEIDALESFAAEVAADGITHAAVLGMGGSSLAPEVFRRSSPPSEGALRLHVLDSTEPLAVKAALGPHGATLPAGMVRPVDGRVLWLVDRAAAALLPVAKAG